MPQLVVVEGTSIGEVYEVSADTTLGSSSINSIVLNDRRVAEQAARFERRGASFHIASLDSQRPVLVNSQPVGDAPLVHGDIVSIGDTMMLYNEEAGDVSSGRKTNKNDRVELRRALGDSTIDDAVREIDARDKAAKRLATLFNVATTIHEITDEQALLERVLDVVFDVFPAERGAVLIGTGADNLRARAHRSQRSRKQAAPKVSRTILKSALSSGEAVLTMDAQDDDRFLSGMSIVEQNIRSAMCAPLVVRDTLVGAIHVDSASRSRAFDRDDLALLTGIAQQAAGAIENARLYRRRQQHTDDLIQLSQVTQQLSSYLDKAQIYPEVVRVASELVSASRVSLLRLTTSKKRGAEIRLVESSGIDASEWREVSMSLEDSLVGQVIRSGESLLVGGPVGQAPETLAYQPNFDRYRSDSFAIVPVASKSDVFDLDADGCKAFAALCATEKHDLSPFSERDVQLLEILANQVGIALTNAELYERATVDALTRVYVRRYFSQKLEELVERAHDKQQPLALIMIDLDHFKRVNDNYGHQTGDVILRELGRLIRAKVRARDIPARYGGEEFAVLLYDTPLDEAAQVADKIHRAVARYPFNRRREQLALTASLGLAALQPGDEPMALLERADSALYEAKGGGRNRVVVAS